MGIARGIFMVHTGGGGGADGGKKLLYHMDKYGVDACVLKTGANGKNDPNIELVKQHPDRFVAICNDVETHRRAVAGEKPWNVEDSVKELDELLATGQFVGIGEGLPRDRTFRKKTVTWEERLDQICQLFELGRKYKITMAIHTGMPIAGFSILDLARARTQTHMADNGNPLLVHEIAALYPDVSILLIHAGVEASGYFMEDYEKCLNVAASHNNVFLETGMWWSELYMKPLKDPNIGAKKLVWGTGWGQPNVYQTWMPGEIPETYNAINLDEGYPKYQPDIFGWSLRELGKLNIPQDDLNLILGGNAALLYKVPTPFPYESMFKTVDRRFWND